MTLWELKGRDGRRYSMFSWRTKMALKHKGLDYDSQPVLMSDKAAIAFSGGKTVPIIKDGETVVRDSWQIAEYLEDRYPERPTLFGGAIGRGMAQAVLKRQSFICGASPAYGDYILFSLFQWARIASPHELVAAGSPLDAWRSRMLDLYDGFARNAATA